MQPLQPLTPLTPPTVWHFNERHKPRLIQQRSVLDRRGESAEAAAHALSRTESPTDARRQLAGTRLHVGATRAHCKQNRHTEEANRTGLRAMAGNESIAPTLKETPWSSHCSTPMP